MLISRLFNWLKNWRAELRAKFNKHLVLREVTKALALTHAQELANTPRNEWALVRSRQIDEIKAVMSGQFDIVDRRSWAYPYLPEALHRLNQPILKNTPYNLRRFLETPVPRRAMNIVKNAVLSFKWEIKPIAEFADDQDPEREQRIRIATETLKRPNEMGDSFRDLFEAVLEDFLTNGAGCIEHRTMPYYKRPTKMWAVDSSTIRLFLDWTESTPDRPRYAQMTGLKGERGIVTFLSGELFYIRDNIRTATPFGLGRGEVAFNSINAFLGVQDMATRAGSDQVHKTWLWWEQTLANAHVNIIRRHITNEIEGQAKISMVAGAKAPQVIDVQAVTPEDLLLDWQKFLIQIIAAAYDLSPQALNMDDHPNRSTAQVMAESDWRNGVVPVATRFQTAFTRLWLHDVLKWRDLEFVFPDLDEPDMMTRTVINQRLYTMSSVTPNEVRKKFGMGPLPGPWGKLTQFQQQLVLLEMQGKFGKAAGAGMGGGMGGGMGMGMSRGMGGGMSSGSLGTGLGGGSSLSFAADDVAQMQPDELRLYQELGLIDPDSENLMNQMDQEQPGILDSLSDELTEYFRKELAEKQADEVQPAPVTPAEEKEQIEKFYKDQHQYSLAEIVINRRGVFGPAINQQVRKNPERGKYPRSGGKYMPPGTEGVDTLGTKKIVKQPKGKYNPGRGNPYQ